MKDKLLLACLVVLAVAIVVLWLAVAAANWNPCNS